MGAVVCHGSPGAPDEVGQFHGADLARRLGIRLIAIARPGMWYSEFQPGRTVAGWVEDPAVVADACGVEQFGIVGYSAGAAYAAAVAAGLPDRVTGMGLVAPVCHQNEGLAAELDRFSRAMERQPLFRPRLTRAVMFGVWHSHMWRPPLRFVLRYSPLLRRPDHLALRVREVRESIVRKSEQAFVAGVSGTQLDMALMMQPWTVDLERISAPTSIWQGTLDTLGATVAMAEYVHDRIDSSDLVLVEDGHLSTMTNHARDIFQFVRGARRFAG